MHNIINDIFETKQVTKVFEVICDKGLWNPKWFLPISVFFSFLPVAILYALNYGRLGDKKKRNLYLIGGCLSFIISIVFIDLFNDLIPQSVAGGFFMGLNVGIAYSMKRNQTEAYIKHINNGGKKASFVIPITISTIIMLVIIGFIIFVTANIPNEKLVFQGDELYYTNSIDRNEVETLGNYLVANQFFQDDGEIISVKIDKSSSNLQTKEIYNSYTFSIIVVDEQYLHDYEFLNYARALAHELSRDVLNHSEVDVDLCDNRFNTLKTVQY